MAKTHKKVVAELLVALDAPLRDLASEDGKLPPKVAKAVQHLAEQIGQTREKQLQRAALTEPVDAPKQRLTDELTLLLDAHLVSLTQEIPKAQRLIAATAEELASKLTRLRAKYEPTAPDSAHHSPLDSDVGAPGEIEQTNSSRAEASKPARKRTAQRSASQ